ncbi:MAG: serine hydrolase [bacterium]|nr:class C beta-lactamase-related serine hydrolase [Gammaproteobacteria bacterium]HIL98164.1 class C beta-lactamase-related serine hydrolase [Pseudomonadales bacterium]
MSNKTLLLIVSLILLPNIVDAAPGAADFMQGAPPDESARVTKANWYVGPFNRWGLQHVREITATRRISRGSGPVSELATSKLPVNELAVETLGGKPGSITDWLESSYTDGFLVLHKGKIISETYMNEMGADSYHNFFSMSKSFTGSLAGILAQRGQLDVNAQITHYVPEMAGGAYEGATVRQLMDMTIGIDYSENYDDPKADVYVYSAASNANPNPTGLALYDVLPNFRKAGTHGEKFHYVTANTDALGWVLQRATKRHLAEMLTTEIWSKLGAERDAYVITDLQGTPWMGAGFNATLRDAGRFGLMMLQKGKHNGTRIVPQQFVDDIQNGAIETGFPGTSYRSQWWVNSNSYSAVGVAGQRITILPEAGLVIVKFSSWPTLSGYHENGRKYDARAFEAIIRYVSQL